MISRRSWKTWQEENPDDVNRCPQCRAEVAPVGNPLQIGIVAEIIRDIKNESQVLRGLSKQKQDTPLGSPVWEPPISVSISESNLTKQGAIPHRTRTSDSVATNQTRSFSTNVTWNHASIASSEVPLSPTEDDFTFSENRPDDIGNDGIKFPRECPESDDHEANSGPNDQMISPLNRRMSRSSVSSGSTLIQNLLGR
jgi:hypothetical protein